MFFHFFSFSHMFFQIKHSPKPSDLRSLRSMVQKDSDDFQVETYAFWPAATYEFEHVHFASCVFWMVSFYFIFRCRGGFGGGGCGGLGWGHDNVLPCRPMTLRSWLSSLDVNTSMMLPSWHSSLHVESQWCYALDSSLGVNASMMLRSWLSSVDVNTSMMLCSWISSLDVNSQWCYSLDFLL